MLWTSAAAAIRTMMSIEGGVERKCAGGGCRVVKVERLTAM